MMHLSDICVAAICCAHTARSSFPSSRLSFPSSLPSRVRRDYVQSVKTVTEDDVDVLLNKAFSMQDMFSRRPLHLYSSSSYSNLCRTVAKQDGSVRESTAPVISQRLLVLLDYPLLKSPYKQFIVPSIPFQGDQALLVYWELRE